MNARHTLRRATRPDRGPAAGACPATHLVNVAGNIHFTRFCLYSYGHTGAHRDNTGATWTDTEARLDVFNGTNWQPAPQARAKLLGRLALVEQQLAAVLRIAERFEAHPGDGGYYDAAMDAADSIREALGKPLTKPTEPAPAAAARWTDPLAPHGYHLAGTELPTTPGRSFDCPACRERGDIGHPFECTGHPDGQLTADEVTALLHAWRCHPDWDYATTTGPRKQWADADVPPPGEGGEPDHTWERNLPAGTDYGWERFDYHEEAYWRRPRATADAPSPTR